jgi:hypothetical protein
LHVSLKLIGRAAQGSIRRCMRNVTFLNAAPEMFSGSFFYENIGLCMREIKIKETILVHFE